MSFGQAQYPSRTLLLSHRVHLPHSNPERSVTQVRGVGQLQHYFIKSIFNVMSFYLFKKCFSSTFYVLHMF